MKRWFRPVAYSTILALVGLAVFGRSGAEPEPVVAAVRPAAHGPSSPRAPLSSMAAPADSLVKPRSDAVFADALFFAAHVGPAIAASAPVPVAEAAPAPPEELKVLGWMLSDTGPLVFVEYRGQSYSLAPTQAVDETYRFDKIGGGLAEFTYLPTGDSRQFTVSDPALIE